MNTTFRQKDGSWQIIVSYKDDDGRWRQKSRQGFKTKKEAKESERELIKAIKNRPRPIDRSIAGISLIEFARIFVKGKQSISDNTRTQYMHAVKSLGSLADKPLKQITYLDIQTAVNNWTTTARTQKQYKCKLNIIFKAAVKPYGLIGTNPVPDIEIKTVRDVTERHTVSDEQFKKLLSLRQDVAIASAILYYTGLRKGELFALTWKDIDFKELTLTVNKQYDDRTGTYTVPKSKNGFRTIPIPAVLINLLRQYHDTAPLDMERRLFPRPAGTYLVLLRAMKKVSQDISPHCLRHTYATHLLAKGIDIRTVAALLGDDTKTVINTYIHYSDEMRKAAADDIQKIFATNF